MAAVDTIFEQLGSMTVLELVDCDVRGEVVDAVDRLAEPDRESLGLGDPDEQGAGQTGTEKTCKWMTAHDLKVRKAGEPEFTQKTKVYGVELFRDAAANAYTYVVLALGLNIVVGFSGLLDLGYAAFFAIGAYTYGAAASGQLKIPWSDAWSPLLWLGQVQRVPVELQTNLSFQNALTIRRPRRQPIARVRML